MSGPSEEPVAPKRGRASSWSVPAIVSGCLVAIYIVAPALYVRAAVVPSGGGLQAVESVSRLLWVWAAVGASLLATAVFLLRRWTRHALAALDDALDRVADGEPVGAIPTSGIAPVDRLATKVEGIAEVRRPQPPGDRRTRRGMVGRYRRLFEEAGSNLFALDAATLEVIDASPLALERVGYTWNDLSSLRASDLWRVDGRPIEERLRALHRDAPSVAFHATRKRRDGTESAVEITALLALDDEPPSIFVLSRELSERQRLERIRDELARFAVERAEILQSGHTDVALREITQLAARTVGVDRASVWLYEDDGITCLDLYDRASERHTDGHCITRDAAPDYFDALDQERTIDATDAVRDPRTRELASTYLEPNGIGAVLDAPVRAGGRLAGVICHEHLGSNRSWTPEEHVMAAAIADFVTQTLEVAERRRAEHALRESERRHRATFEQAAVGMAETDPDGRFRRMNPRLREMLGYTHAELVDLRWSDVVHPDDAEAVVDGLAALRTGRAADFQRECRCRRKNGSELWLEITAGPVWSDAGTVSSLITVATDVSAARDLQTQLVHAQRMESIGRLAGGIAHDFNNLLTAIIGHAELGGAVAGDDDPVQHDLKGIEESARRASTLTRQLLTFARRQVVEPRTVDVDKLLENAESLLRRLSGDEIELTTEYVAGGAAVMIDPGQLEQVIVNLTVNARDAMPHGGNIEIRTRLSDLDAPLPTGGEELPPGRYVEISVSDDGTGMEEELVDRIFEPFFTTKPSGRGTGLGLATCYGIVGQAGGAIRVESTVGEGSTFSVLLPLHRDPAEAEAAPDTADRDEGGDETVLVAEDEDSVRRLVVESLRRKGYVVLAAADGAEALETAEGHDGPIDVLVTDIVMPRMRGPQLAARLRARRPEVKVLFMSGYSGSADTEDALTIEESVFVAKPFTPTQLTARVRELLDG